MNPEQASPMRCRCGRALIYPGDKDPWCEGCHMSSLTCDCIPVQASPSHCNCWLGTTATSGDSATREKCPVHGGDRRDRCVRLIQSMPESGLDEAVQSLSEMVTYWTEIDAYAARKVNRAK